MRNRWHGGKEVHGLIHLHLQHIANALAAPADGQRFGVEARAVADLAGHFHIGQKAHLNGAHALTFASRAAAFAGVEAKTPRRIAARLGLQRLSKQFANGVPEANISCGAGTRCFTDGGLINLQHAVNPFKALNALAADQLGRLAFVHGVAPGLGRALLHPGRHIGQQHIARQCGFARAGYACHGHQTLERHARIHAL